MIVYGVGGVAETGIEPPMTWSWESPEEGLMLSTLVDPWLLYPSTAARAGWAHVRTLASVALVATA